MAIRAVIDTNIWVSAILNPFGFPSKLRHSFTKGLFQPVISEPMFLELAEVLNRPRIKDKYGLAAADITELLLLIEERSESVHGTRPKSTLARSRMASRPASSGGGEPAPGEKGFLIASIDNPDLLGIIFDYTYLYITIQ